ncbi:hypothetical protein [Caballeronia arationis]|uniref:hypothetical protein n=1 Tax=Caballeronia arationis TaxID=1777142 RepID=UPI00119829F3|nr:hypothetical protein [Caballeronia arationis]
MSRLRAEIGASGFACMPDALDATRFGALQAEASVRRQEALRACGDGDVRYRSRVAPLGDVARAFLAGSELASALESVFDDAYAYEEEASCYTYYESGDFLGVHRDRPDECEITVIVYLHAQGRGADAPDTGLRLDIYSGGDTDERRLVHFIPTRTGGMVLGRGAAVWHARPPLLQDESVIALTACFRARTRPSDGT